MNQERFDELPWGLATGQFSLQQMLDVDPRVPHLPFVAKTLVNTRAIHREFIATRYGALTRLRTELLLVDPSSTAGGYERGLRRTN